MISSTPDATASIRMWSVLAVVATWASLLGPAWVFVPAQPAIHTPSANLNFAELASFSALTPSTFQLYFNVLAWLLAAVITLVARALSHTHPLVAGISSSVIGYTSLLITLVALHSLPTTQNFWHNLASLRLGAALALLGALALARAGYLTMWSDLRERRLSDAPTLEPAEKAWAE